MYSQHGRGPGATHQRGLFQRRIKSVTAGLARIPQMDCHFDDLLERFCYKNQCNTISVTGKPRATQRVNQETPIYGSISTVD